MTPSSNGRRKERALPLLDFNISAKKVVLLVSGGKTKFHHFCPTPGKILERSPSGPPLKNSFRYPWLILELLLKVLRVISAL